MKKSLCLLCLLFVSCAITKPVSLKYQYSFLPPKINLDSLMPPNKDIVDSNLKDFRSIAIDSGRLVTIYKDTLNLNAGILISERKAALYTYYKSNSEYLDKKCQLSNKLFSEYYNSYTIVEKKYQEEIEKLSIQSERNWYEKNIIYFGFALGIIASILTEFAVINTQKI